MLFKHNKDKTLVGITGKRVHKSSTAYPLAISLLSMTATAAQAAVIINEVDYDQPGADQAEFIELYNNGTSTVSLDNYRLELINGNDLSVYQTIVLDGFRLEADSYLVVCNDVNQVANCQLPFTSRNGWIQNGAPDGIALYDQLDTRIDAMSYEGEISGLTEQLQPLIKDSNATVMSLIRLPNGSDTNNNRIDFASGCLTPGTANISGSGDCSVQQTINTVPLPASFWLFTSGLLGLLRYRQLG